MWKIGHCITLCPKILQMPCLRQDLVGNSYTLSAIERATDFPIRKAPNLLHLPSLERRQGLLLVRIEKAAPSLSVQTLQTLPKSSTHKDVKPCALYRFVRLAILVTLTTPVLEAFAPLSVRANNLERQKIQEMSAYPLDRDIFP